MNKMEAASDDSLKDNIEKVSPNNNSEEPSIQPAQDASKKKTDRSKKDDKNVEQFMKSLNSVPTLEEKLSLVCKKYVQTADDNKKMQFYIKQADKRHALLMKDKDQLQHEYNVAILMKSKLENLCRELQKQNKAIKEESLLKIREEEERRKETHSKFQNTLSEITALLQQNNDKNAKLRDDNITMSEKFQSVVKQYELREQQVDKMAKQMALESQLSEAKLQKASLEHQAERERMAAEMEHLKVAVAQGRARVLELQATETALKGQLGVYTSKYDEFQNALVKSNQVFGGFKEQMELMSKKIKKLEKESLSWKQRWEGSQKALLDMCGERQAGDQRAAAQQQQLHHMQQLCRTLQAERTALVNTLKEHNIERPSVPLPAPAPAPAPAAAPANNSNVDAMAVNCAQLRQSLAHLQNQLNVLTNKKEETPKPEKPKKNKSKKKDKSKEKSQEKVETNAEEVSEKVEAVEVNPESSIKVEATNEVKVESTIDNKTLDTLINAISDTNINKTDLELTNEDDKNAVKEIKDTVAQKENESVQNEAVNGASEVPEPVPLTTELESVNV